MTYDRAGNITEYKSVSDYMEREKFIQIDDSDDLPFD